MGKPKNGYHIWSSQEIDLYKSWYGKISFIEMQNKFFNYLTLDQLRTLARKLKLKQTNKCLHRKFHYNENYFKIPLIENSYYAGLIAADGCLYSPKNRQHTTNFKIGLKDKDLIQRFKTDTSNTGEIKESIKDGHILYNIYYHGVENSWANDLRNNFNIVRNKTKILRPPMTLSDIHSLAFAKGLVDGDGWISCARPTKTNYIQLKLGLCGTLEMVSWFNETVRNHCDIAACTAQIHPIKSIYKIEYTGNFALIVGDLLYRSASLGLSRKWRRYSKAKELLSNGKIKDANLAMIAYQEIMRKN